LSEREKGFYEKFKENYQMRWGRVPAGELGRVIPRKLGAKDDAQLRDVAIEVAAAGHGNLECDDETIKKAFDEAGSLQKYSVSYVRAVLFDWLGIERKRATR